MITRWRRRLRTLLVATMGAGFALLPAPGWGQGFPDGPWGWHWMWGAWGVGMMGIMLLFWGALLTALVLGIRWVISAGGRQEDALEILKRRYARGELSREEYEIRRQDLWHV